MATAITIIPVCRLMNRFMDMPMRPYSGEEELEPLTDEQLPAAVVVAGADRAAGRHDFGRYDHQNCSPRGSRTAPDGSRPAT